MLKIICFSVTVSEDFALGSLILILDVTSEKFNERAKNINRLKTTSTIGVKSNDDSFLKSLFSKFIT